ncbi:hypothetical protein [Dactylosporangium sp. NPDC049140]|uniref:hypothetical protein n=1 Tax=Dactylosporangium sp. NPDC049140 TaxID=3155647 RepID=UPI0033CFD316
MQHNGGDEPRPVEVIGVREYRVPLPFAASSVKAPELSVAPTRRRRWLRVVLACWVAVVVAAALYLAPGTDARPVAATGSAAPTASARSKSRAEVKADLINDGLAAQSRALLAGDLDGYLAHVDVRLHDEFTQRFHSLRALGVARWTARVTKMPPDIGDQSSVVVTVGYCLGDAGCEPAVLVLPSRWTVQDGRAVATKFERTVLPWDLTPLRAVAGRRVILAVPASHAGDLRPALAAADQAADIADRFARWGAPPKRYVVYFAGPDEWRTWFHGRGKTSDGYAAGPYGMKVRAEQIGRDGLSQLLAHEFTHVVSVGLQDDDREDWWLVEGLAEYVADRDGSWTRDRLPFVRRYLRAGRWDGAITLGSMPEGASEDDGRARYGIALLAVTCLVKRFGEDRMLDFFTAVVREQFDPETAAPKVFGAEWAPVAAACAAEVRARAR